MAKRSASRGVAAYASRESMARPFARRNGQPSNVYDIADEALGRCDDVVREHWRSRVQALSDDDVRRLVSAVPGMSEVVRTFVVELVMCTRWRILDGARS